MNTGTFHQNRVTTQEEQRLYNHLLQLVQIETPEQMLDRVRLLFIEGIDYPDFGIQRDLDRLVQSSIAAQEFRFILNRCCHILINRWQARPQSHRAIVDLIALFEASPTKIQTDLSRLRLVKQLQDLIQHFRTTEQYLTLKRLANVMHQSETVPAIDAQPLGGLIRRYPFVYEHSLVSEGTPDTHQASIRQLQADRQRQFELDLSRYATYQVRRSTSERLIHPVQNPTLLSDQELSFALKQFVGKVDGKYTCRDVAHQFLNHCRQVRSYRDFKGELYHHLTEAIEPAYGKRHFNRQLANFLQSTFPDSDAQPFTDFLLVRTSTQLLNFLVLENKQRPQHFLLIDLLSNMGATLTTRLLLKVVLLCQRVKPYLEKQFSILFHHYEGHQRDRVQWLIAAMENLHIALSTNFSALNLCFVNQLSPK